MAVSMAENPLKYIDVNMMYQRNMWAEYKRRAMPSAFMRSVYEALLDIWNEKYKHKEGFPESLNCIYREVIYNYSGVSLKSITDIMKQLERRGLIHDYKPNNGLGFGLNFKITVLYAMDNGKASFKMPSVNSEILDTEKPRKVRKAKMSKEDQAPSVEEQAQDSNELAEVQEAMRQLGITPEAENSNKVEPIIFMPREILEFAKDVLDGFKANIVAIRELLAQAQIEHNLYTDYVNRGGVFFEFTDKVGLVHCEKIVNMIVDKNRIQLLNCATSSEKQALFYNLYIGYQKKWLTTIGNSIQAAMISKDTKKLKTLLMRFNPQAFANFKDVWGRFTTPNPT